MAVSGQGDFKSNIDQNAQSSEFLALISKKPILLTNE